MNDAIASVARTQAPNSASAGKIEHEAFKAAEEVVGGQNTATESSVSSKYDTLDLSRAYVKYKTQSGNSALYDQTNQLNSTVIEYAAGSGKNNKQVSFNYQLYSYTETELLEMMNAGKITPEEYEKEMKSRNPDFEKEIKRGPSLENANKRQDSGKPVKRYPSIL